MVRTRARGRPVGTPPMAPRRMPYADTWPDDLLALYSATTLRGFIQQAFRVLPRVVPCEYVSAFYRRAGEGFLKERDSRGRVWTQAFMRRYVELNPAIPLVLANPGVKVISTRRDAFFSNPELPRTPFYREIMRRQGWRHAAVFCFWGDPPASFPIFVVSLFRSEGQRDFSDGELARLEEVHPFLAPAINRFHQISASNAVSEGIAAVLQHVAGGIVVLDWQLQVVRMNMAGRRACARWATGLGRESLQRATRSATVPTEILQVCRDVRRELQSAMRRNPDAAAQRRQHVRSTSIRGLSASVTAMCQASEIVEPSFVIEFEGMDATSAPRTDVPLPLPPLTKAEREVALVVARGLSNEETAERLGKTLSSVKFLLHRVYTKLGVPNRARLALLLRAHADV